MSTTRLKCALPLALALLALAPAAAHAATFTVNSVADARDDNPGDGLCVALPPAAGQCTLRAAVMEANALPGPDTIVFDPATDGTPIILTIPCDPIGCFFDLATDGDLDSVEDLTITGNGAARTLIYGGAGFGLGVDRVFESLGAPLTISGVTVRFGNATEDGRGGALEANGPVTVTDSVFADNRALNPDGFGTGGALYCQDDLLLRRVSVSGNLSRLGGGVFWDTSVAVLTVTDSTFDGNTASGGNGGGLFSGAFGPTPPPIGIINTTFSGNVAADGCAIYHTNAPLRVQSVTVADNCSAGSPAAAVLVTYGDGNGNQGGEVVFENTILSSRAGTDNCRVETTFGVPPGFRSEGYNLASDASCGLVQTGDVQGTSAVLGPLAANGGPTRTHLPLAGSPAIDTGTPTDCPPTDQRGLGRPANGGSGFAVCDKGSVEVTAGPPPPPPTTGSVQGVAWNDVNGNGTREPGDNGVPGLQVCVFPTVPLVCSTTAADGSYLVPGLSPGNDQVYVRLPGRLVSTTPRTVPVTVAAGGLATVDFGSWTPPVPPFSLFVNAAWTKSNLPVRASTLPLRLVATPACPAVSVAATLGLVGGASSTQAMTPTGGNVWETTFPPPFLSGPTYLLTVQVACAGGGTETIAGSLLFVDPSGTILDGCTGAPLAGATVTLLKNEPAGSATYVSPDPSETIPTTNPEVTAADGLYAWDVVPGRWKVQASKAGYDGVTTAPFDVPPPVTGLDITLVPTAGCNTPPVANDDAYATTQASALSVPAPGLLGNDTDADHHVLTARLVSGPASGTLLLRPDGSFTYAPAPSFSGTDSFTYKASDGQAESNVARVTITVRKVNRPPVARDDTYTTKRNRAFFIPAPGVLGNDSDPEGARLRAALVRRTAHGFLFLDPSGWFAYLPAPGFVGKDTFTYTASDGVQASSPATVTINVVRRHDGDRDDDDDDHHDEHGGRR